MKLARGGLTYANVVATIALFVALGGGAYAMTAGKNTVKSKSIKNGQVKAADLHRASVTSKSVANRSLLGIDFAPDELPPGPKGDTGAQGVPGLSAYEVVAVPSPFNSTAAKSASATCPTGKKPIGGGAEVFPDLTDPNRDTAPIAIKQSQPSGNTWFGAASEMSAYAPSWTLQTYAVCANVG